MIEAVWLRLKLAELRRAYRISRLIHALGPSFLLSAAVLVLASLTAFPAPGTPLSWITDNRPLVLVLSLLAGLPGALLQSLRPVDDFALVARADEAAGLRQLFLTGARIQQSDRRDEFSLLVMRRAEQASRSVRGTEVFRPAVGRTHVAGLVCLALAVLLLALVPSSEEQTRLGYLEAAQRLEQDAERLAERAQESQDEEARRLADELQRLAEQLSVGELTPSDAREEASRLRDDVQDMLQRLDRAAPGSRPGGEQELTEEQEEMRQALERALANQEIQDFLARGRRGGDTPAESLDQLDDLTEEAFPGPGESGREDAEQALEELLAERENQEMRRDLEEAERSLEGLDGGEQQELAEGAPGDFGETGEGTDPDDRPPDAPSGDETGESREPSESRDSGRLGGEEGGIGGDVAEEDRFDDDATRLDDNATAMSRVQGEVTGRQFMRQFLREMPEQASPERQEQTVIRDFDRLIESVVEQQDVPVEYRELVREYFLRMSRN